MVAMRFYRVLLSSKFLIRHLMTMNSAAVIFHYKTQSIGSILSVAERTAVVDKKVRCVLRFKMLIHVTKKCCHMTYIEKPIIYKCL